MLNSETQQDSHSTENDDTSTSKRSIFLYTIFGLCIFFKPGDPYLWENCTTNSTISGNTSNFTSNSTYTPLGKGISEQDTITFIIPFYYVTNLILATPVYLLVSKYNLLKQCQILQDTHSNFYFLISFCHNFQNINKMMISAFLSIF